jgi:hypothetical protein
MVRGRLLGTLETQPDLVGQQVECPDRRDAHATRLAVTMAVTLATREADALDRVADDAQETIELVILSSEVLRRQEPQSDVRDLEVEAPLEETVDVRRACLVPVRWVGKAPCGRVATISIEYDADVARKLTTGDLTCQTALIDAVEEALRHT